MASAEAMIPMETEDAAAPDVGEIEVLSEQWKTKGNDRYKAKDYRGAIDAYSTAIKYHPTNAALYNNRAAAHVMLLEFKEAIADCDRCINLDASNSKAMFRKATAYKALGNINAAIDALNAGLVHDPSSAVAKQDRDVLVASKARIEAVKVQFQNRDYRRALMAIDQLIKDISANCREINILKVECLVELKRTEEAYNLTNTMMRAASMGDIELLSVRAKIFYKMGDIENAVKHLHSAVKSDPDNTTVRALYRKYKDLDEKKESGNAAFKRGAYEEAIDSWTQAIKIDQHNDAFVTKLYSNRATAYFKLKRYEESIQDCSRVISIDSSFLKAYVRRAEAYFALGGKENIEKCIRDYERIGELQSGDEEGGNIDVKAKIQQAKVALKRSSQKDLYSILGVGRDADEEEIRKAYRKMALKHHPDKQAGKTDEEKAKSENMFKVIGEAYEILSDPEKKRRYDEGVDVEDIDNPHAGAGGGGFGHGHGGHGGIDPNILFQMFMQQQGGGRGGFSF